MRTFALRPTSNRQPHYFMNANTYVAIMAGGVGSRFWPASREARPKQFLDILGAGKSLLRHTFERFLALCPVECIYVVTHANYCQQVLEHLPELHPCQVIGEPVRRNTAPCVAYTAFKLYNLNPQANLVIVPADHIIQDEVEFLRVVRHGLDFSARHDALLTIGIRPTRPDTGYGYIQFEQTPAEGEVHKTLRFTEKPPLEKAQEFLLAGNYLWNAGVFIWRAEVVLQAFAQYSQGIYNSLQAGSACYNTPEEAAFVEATYPELPNISVDYALMERASNVYTLPASFGWSDLGTWASLHAESLKDDQANAVQCQYSILQETRNCLIRTPQDKLVVVRGLDDFIVVDEGDVLLIYPKSKEQEIKNVSKVLANSGQERFI